MYKTFLNDVSPKSIPQKWNLFGVNLQKNQQIHLIFLFWGIEFLLSLRGKL